MFLNIAAFVKRAILPFLPNLDGCNSMSLVCLLYASHFIVSYRASIACNKVVEPFMIHSLMLWQMIEHRVQHGIEISCHKVLRLFQQLMVWNIFAQFRSSFSQILFFVATCTNQQCSNSYDYKFLHSSSFYKYFHINTHLSKCHFLPAFSSIHCLIAVTRASFSSCRWAAMRM